MAMPCPNRFNFLPVRIALLCYLWFFGIDASAQIFPVQATTQLVPPYSVYLSDYATPGNEKLRVILLQRDLSQPAYQVRLAMSVELNGRVIIRTSRTFNPPPINLTPGIPAVISGADLFPYLHSRNLDFVGYSREQYERTKALPEGGYQITFTAYDYRRQDVQISNAGSSFYYLSKSEPPLINVPACGTKVPMRTPQQIVFSWLPRNTASPTSVADTQYELSLYEVRPQGRNPNDIVASTQPVFKATLDFPQYVYTPADPLLLENMQYVWRVRAIDRNGKDAFRNNGYSEICTFTYTSEGTIFDIGTVKNLKAEGQTPTRGRIWWALGEYDSYQVGYRKTGNASYEWFPARVTTKELKEAQKTQAEVKLFDLEPDTEYEARVQAQKSGYLGAYSEIVKFRTWPVQPSNCGDDEDDPSIPEADDDHPLLDGIRGMIIQLDDLEMQLMEVVHLGQGWYQGTGRTRVPFLGNGNFAVTFDRLYIDENRVAGDGRVVFVTRGTIAQVEQQMQHAAIKAREEKKQENRSKWTGTVFHNRIFEYSSIVIDTIAVSPAGVVEITDAQGQVTMNTEVAAILATTPEKAIIIEDRKGDQYVVQRDKASGQTSVTKVDGGGLSPDNSTNFTTVQSDPVKDRIIVLILEQFEEEIGAWLRIHGKGGEEDPDVLLAEDMPACFERDARFLKYINENTIPYFKEHPAELRAKAAFNEATKNVLDRLAADFKAVDDVNLTALKDSDLEALTDAACAAVNENALIIIDRLIACLAGATIDVGLQYTFKWVELWMGEKPVSFTDYKAVFGSLDASQVAVSASIACAAAMIPIIPSSKNKLTAAVVAGLGDGANAMANNIYKQYDELESKYPDATVGELIGKINWTAAVQEGGVNFVITGISTGVVLYARSNPKFINFARQLEEKIKAQGVGFLEQAGLSKESIDLLLNKLGIRNVKTFLLQLPKTPVNIQNGNINITDHWNKFSTSFNLDESIAQAIRKTTGTSIASLAEEGVVKQFVNNGFVPFLTKYGGNNGLDALLANSNNLASATRVILLEIKSSAVNSVPFNVTLGKGYGGYQLDDIWLDGVITKMIGSEEISKTIQGVGRALRRMYDTNASVIEKYVVEVDGNGLVRLIRID